MRAAGFTTKWSNGGEQIEIKHRVSMVNALLKDATDRRRLFLAPSQTGAAQAAKLSECLGSLMWGANGIIDYRGKTKYNLAHWGDALGYALFPFEKFRGGFKAPIESVSSTAPSAWRKRA
jgi:hypothetical protein